jgi:hypothetical protein
MYMHSDLVTLPTISLLCISDSGTNAAFCSAACVLRRVIEDVLNMAAERARAAKDVKRCSGHPMVEILGLSYFLSSSGVISRQDRVPQLHWGVEMRA